MEFEVYLESKKIDPKAYREQESEQFAHFKSLFLQMSPKSFTSQKLFLINEIRRRFPFKADEETKAPAKKSARPVVKSPAAKPALKPKPKTGKPVVKPKVAQAGKARPVVKKPVIKPPKEDSEESKKPTKKPVIKPKIVKAGKPKPVVKKPVIKPKINKDQK